jgi:hypothetical protein
MALLDGSPNDGLGPLKNPVGGPAEVSDPVVLSCESQINRKGVHNSIQLCQRLAAGLELNHAGRYLRTVCFGFRLSPLRRRAA